MDPENQNPIPNTPQSVQPPTPAIEQPPITLMDQTPKPKNNFLVPLAVLLVVVSLGLLGFWAYKNFLSNQQANQSTNQSSTSPIPVATPITTNECVDKGSLDCTNEPELSFKCTQEYQDWAVANCPGWEEGQFCGGITGRVCPEGYSCKLDGNYPDAGGVCTKLIEQTPPISKSELSMGWYYGTKNQKKKNTPTTWVYTEAGKSSCWHELNTQCGFLPD